MSNTLEQTPHAAAIDWIDDIRRKIYEETKGMSPKEFTAYINVGAEEFERGMAEARRKREAEEAHPEICPD